MPPRPNASSRTAPATPGWFEQITGFAETGWADTQRRLLAQVEDGHWLRHASSGRRVDMGRFSLPTLAALRGAMAAQGPGPGRPTRVSVVEGESRALHGDPALAGAVFQAASQFNLLEMTSPSRRPEDGVTGYVHDPTQGPACAVAAGGGTLWRNYLVEGPQGRRGQTEAAQLDGLAGVGEALAQAMGTPASALWTMRNGYALFGPGQVQAVAAHLRRLDAGALDALGARLAVGVQHDVDVTALPEPWPAVLPQVTQVYCSALPVAYNHRSDATLEDWAPLAQRVLDATYEATLRVAALQARSGGSPVVLLTLVGGGVFGNPRPWILSAIGRAVQAVAGEGLDVRLVSFGAPPKDLRETVARLQALV